MSPRAAGHGTGGLTYHRGGYNTGGATGIDIAGVIDHIVRKSFLMLDDVLANTEVLELSEASAN